MTNTTTRRRKSPLTGKYVTIPVELVPNYEIYQKVAKRHMKHWKGNEEAQRAKGARP